MAKVEYREYLNSEAWQHRRRLALDAAGHRCQICNSGERLEVHHRSYEHLGTPLESKDVVVLCETHHGLFHADTEPSEDKPERIGELLEGSMERLEAAIKGRGGVTGLATGIRRLDEMLCGLQPSNLVVLASRPSVGKTAFALNIAFHAGVILDKSVLVFSLEMCKAELVQRMVCIAGGIDLFGLRTGFLQKSAFEKITYSAESMVGAPIYLDDSSAQTPPKILAKAAKHKKEHGLDLLIIDYLQLMSAGGRRESRQVEVSEISRSLKSLARALDVPVLALSQLNRASEEDETGLPKLSHLRESGALEQDADVVMLLNPFGREGAESNLRLNVAKHRNGPTGPVPLRFDHSTQRISGADDPSPTG